MTSCCKKVAVIGCGFGDEGKGRVVNTLSSSHEYPLVVRFSGGHQVGHNVVTQKCSHVFSNFGSGTLQYVPTYWSSNCTINPVGIVTELSELERKDYNPIIYIDSCCPVTTPYDIYKNIDFDKMNRHGTVGVGFGSTLQREEDYYSLQFGDLFYKSVRDIKLNHIKNYYGIKESISNTVDLEYFIECCDAIVKDYRIKLFSGNPTKLFDMYDKTIFEGSQGLLLDQHFGFFPHVTRSNTGLKNIHKYGIDTVYLVTRAYQTRHGNGPMTNEDIEHTIKVNPYEQNVEDGAQGKFRRSILDLDLLKYAIEKDKHIQQVRDKILVITCVDLITEYAFTINGEKIVCNWLDEFVDKIGNYLNIDKTLISNDPAGKLIQGMGK